MGEVIIKIQLEEWMAYASLILLFVYTILSLVSVILKYKLLKLRRNNEVR